MWTRAWIIGIVLTSLDLLELIGGNIPFDNFGKSDEQTIYKQGVIDDLIPYGSKVYKSIIVFNTILCILSFKWRSLSRLFFHNQVIAICLYEMIPRGGYCGTDEIVNFTYFIFILLYACDIKSCMISLTVAYLTGRFYLYGLWSY